MNQREERELLDAKIVECLSGRTHFASVAMITQALADPNERDHNALRSFDVGRLVWKGTDEEVPERFTEVDFGRRHMKESLVRSALKRLVRDGKVTERARSMNRSDRAKRRDYALPEIAQVILAEDAVQEAKYARQREANLQLLKRAMDVLTEAGIDIARPEVSRMSIRILPARLEEES